MANDKMYLPQSSRLYGKKILGYRYQALVNFSIFLSFKKHNIKFQHFNCSGYLEVCIRAHPNSCRIF